MFIIIRKRSECKHTGQGEIRINFYISALIFYISIAQSKFFGIIADTDV